MLVRRATLLVLATTAPIVASAAPAAAQGEIRCPAPPGFKASRVTVPIDRAGKVKGSIKLCVQRKPATGTRAGALFLLAGGPGQSATVLFEGSAGAGKTVRSVFGGAPLVSRDLVVFDQRGTGASGPLSCVGEFAHEPQGPSAPVALPAGSVGSCASRLGARRSFYTTRDSVEDIEAVRRKLGVPKIALYGVSYGAKVAVAYALQYPQRIERMVLDSIFVPEGPDAYERDSIAAMPRVLKTVCGTACASFTSDPAADLRALVAKMASGPLRGPVVNSYGDRGTVEMDRHELLDLMLAGDFSPDIRGDFSSAVAAALKDDPTPLLRLMIGGTLKVVPVPKPDPSQAPEDSHTLFLTTTCEETAWPWARSAKTRAERLEQARVFAAGRPDSDFFPFDRATALQSAELRWCADWPQAVQPPALGPGPLPGAPTLLINGEDDLRSTVENLQAMAARIPGARTLTVAAFGHSVILRSAALPQTVCARAALKAFLADQTTPARCDGPRPVVPREPAPRSLDAVTPAPGAAGKPGQALQAVALALDDAFRAASVIDPRESKSLTVIAGGLRSGRLRANVTPGTNGHARISRLSLGDWSYVPGVSITGDFTNTGGRLTGPMNVTGALPGALTLAADGKLAGRLGGQSVSTQLP